MADTLPPQIDETDLQGGHRQRLRDRFNKGGADALADYELLELLLFLVIPRRDVKPLAKQLLKQFNTIDGVLNATQEQLAAFKGLGANAISALKTMQAVMQRRALQQVMHKPILSSWERVLDYCQTVMGHEKIEQLRLLFLDKKNCLMADEVQQTGTIDHTPAYPREIIKRALNLGASAIIVVHNHPSGDPRPSKADIDLTGHIHTAAKAMGIALHDHLIIARDKHFSFKAEGLL